ncbi:MAG: alpha-1,4-glucan--maltose-1-phosphate maltosyltransferase [Acidobacteriota bacterium]
MQDGRQRVVITAVAPQLDGGRFPVKRTPGESVRVEADIFADGHDLLACRLLYRRKGQRRWRELPMEHLGNDRWAAEFTVEEEAPHEFTLAAWVDRYATWREAAAKKLQAGQSVELDLREGAVLIEEAAEHAPPAEARRLRAAASAAEGHGEESARFAAAASPEVAELMARHAPRRFAVTHPLTIPVAVERERARYGAWYEMFPRSASPEPGRHGTFRDVIALLPYVAGMGFDVLYLPPIHPIGTTHRKGANNALLCGPGDPGSPWAIGSEEGGHKSIHPELGTFEEFRELVAEARRHELEVALDVAFQCSPDHPYVREHPQWFRHRADGTIRYAENPPKRYEDIVPFDFECEDWLSLWRELRSIFEFWIGEGISIFRVDNPHTKPFAFWEWCLGSLKRSHPETIFLSEAFTRPKVMARLAKAGFSQSYTYFTWRTGSWELREYFRELTSPPLKEFLRPNLFANTPDILHAYLQEGGRPAFAVRLVLAATLGASYGIYGPPFELCVKEPREPGSEEYLHSEKYEIRHWDRQSPESLRGLIARVNTIRRANKALHFADPLTFHETDNPNLLAYSKRRGENVLLMVVNLDPRHRQSGWTRLQLGELGLPEGGSYQVEDLLGGETYTWNGPRNFVELDPQRLPAHILRVSPARGVGSGA